MPHRLSPKHREDGPKGNSARSSRSPSSSSPRRSASPHQNGHKGSAQNGRHSHGPALEEPTDVRRLFLHHGLLPSPPLPPPFAGIPHPGSPLPSFPTLMTDRLMGTLGAGCPRPCVHMPPQPWDAGPSPLGRIPSTRSPSMAALWMSHPEVSPVAQQGHCWEWSAPRWPKSG